MILKLLILWLMCCGSSNSCGDHNSATTTTNTITTAIWENCCINSTSGARYSCITDQQNDDLSCMSGDEQFIEMICLKNTNNPCTVKFIAPDLVIDYEGKTFMLQMESSSSYLMIQRNILDNSDFFLKSLSSMQGTLSSPNVDVGNFWIGLTLLNALTNIAGYKTALEIKIAHTVNSDVFTVDYSDFKVGDAASSYLLTVSGFTASDAAPGVTIIDAFRISYHIIDSLVPANGKPFTVANCASIQMGAWWMNQYCSNCNLNGGDGTYGWEYSTDNSETAITGSLMGIRFTRVVNGN